MLAVKVLNLTELNIPSLALTSLTPKDQVTSIHNQIEADESLRLLYGTAPDELSIPFEHFHLTFML